MIYVFLANGFEEIEALAPVDIMRRAGLNVKTVGIGGRVVYGAHDIPVTADMDDKQVKKTDIEAIVLPGGSLGTENLEKSEAVQEVITYCAAENILIGAICAAPSILGHRGLLRGKSATAYPSFQKELEGASLAEAYVCKDGNIITARGMGVSLAFGFQLVETLVSKEKAEEIREQIQCVK